MPILGCVQQGTWPASQCPVTVPYRSRDLWMASGTILCADVSACESECGKDQVSFAVALLSLGSFIPSLDKSLTPTDVAAT